MGLLYDVQPRAGTCIQKYGLILSKNQQPPAEVARAFSRGHPHIPSWRALIENTVKSDT